MTLEQQKQRIQQMQEQMTPIPQMPVKRQGMSKGKPWYDRFGWWTVLMIIVVSALVVLVYLPPLK